MPVKIELSIEASERLRAMVARCKPPFDFAWRPTLRELPIPRNRSLVLRSSFANPFTWGWHRFLWACQTAKGSRY